jgi:SAM-dependent methyltransferase
MASEDISGHLSQQRHWSVVFSANPDMYGAQPSEAAISAADYFADHAVDAVLELGAGQGRDTMFFDSQGFKVVALDYADDAIRQLSAKSANTGPNGVAVIRHDVRQALPFAANSFDACYSHMLFCMALSTSQIKALMQEVRRILRPSGTIVYTVRHTGDAHYEAGIAHGDDLFENGGFVVHFFSDALVRELSDGFELVEVEPFNEGELPRQLWRVTMRKTD